MITTKCISFDIIIRLSRIYFFEKTCCSLMFMPQTRHHVITQKTFCSKHLSFISAYQTVWQPSSAYKTWRGYAPLVILQNGVRTPPRLQNGYGIDSTASTKNLPAIKPLLQHGLAPKFCLQNSLATKFYLQNGLAPKLCLQKKVCQQDSAYKNGLATKFCLQNGLATKFYLQNGLAPKLC